MKAPTTALLFGGFASFALAQQQYKIDPNNVANTTRQLWCTSQESTCPLICLQTPGNAGAAQNTCDPTTLQYQCICTNGLSPNVSEYTQTLPYFICTEWGRECVANCGNNNLCAADCLQHHPCGAQNATRVNVTSSSAASTASKTSSATTSLSDAIYTGFAGASTTPSTGDAAAFQPVALDFGRAWGMAVVMAGLFAGFAILL